MGNPKEKTWDVGILKTKRDAQVKEGYVRGLGLRVGFRSLAGLRERERDKGRERKGGRGRGREKGDHPKEGGILVLTKTVLGNSESSDQSGEFAQGDS